MADAPVVGIIMGSQSDWETMSHTSDILGQLGVAHETRIVSAHRTPKRLLQYGESARDRGLQVIIAGAGGAAHLPGMTAAITALPVFGVPIESKALSGMDSLLSIVQMPGGIPVGTLAIGRAGAINAGLLAAAVIALNDNIVRENLDAWRAKQTSEITETPSDGYLRPCIVEPGKRNWHTGWRAIRTYDGTGRGTTGLWLSRICSRSWQPYRSSC